jgi:hypothetical protein
MAAERRDVPMRKRQAHVHLGFQVVPVFLEASIEEPAENDPPLAVVGRDCHQTAVADERPQDPRLEPRGLGIDGVQVIGHCR